MEEKEVKKLQALKEKIEKEKKMVVEKEVKKEVAPKKSYEVTGEKSIVLKVGAKTSPPKCAGAIVKNLAEGKKVELLSVGAGAVNQCVKAIAIARTYAASEGKDLACIPAFQDIVIEDAQKTAIKMLIIDLRK